MADTPPTKHPPRAYPKGAFRAIKDTFDRVFSKVESTDKKIADLEKRLAEVERLAGVR